MAKKRNDITNADVFRVYNQCRSFNKAAKILNCSTQIIFDVLHGKRICPELKIKPRRKRNREMCTCCEIRERKKGNKFLCEYCYKNGIIDDSMIINNCYQYYPPQ
jgi:hypothetical protein